MQAAAPYDREKPEQSWMAAYAIETGLVFSLALQGPLNEVWPLGNQYWASSNLYGEGELDIGRAYPLFQASCNISYLPLADFLSVTDNTRYFCQIGEPAAQPPYYLQVTTSSSYQPTSLTPFPGQSVSGRRLQQGMHWAAVFCICMSACAVRVTAQRSSVEQRPSMTLGCASF